MVDSTIGDSLRIGFIGLGDMGAAMAHNIVDHNWPLALYARRLVSLEPFRARPVVIANSPCELGALSDILCLCVVDEAQIEDVLFGAEGAALGLGENSVVVIHSTIAPDACRRFADRLAPLGVHLIDAPVTGAAERGRSGDLTIVVGGEESVVRRCMPLFETEGANIVHLGGVGSGQVGMLLNNGLFVIHISLIDELLKLSEKMGLDPTMVLNVIDKGTAGSWASGFYRRVSEQGQIIFANYDTSYPGGVIEIVRKDIRLFVKELSNAGFKSSRIANLASGAVDSIGMPVAEEHGDSTSTAARQS
jgi:3-hydroxyisobutyrate dehydrogenase-like beta-hydroxyacid dehydrogenase